MHNSWFVHSSFAPFYPFGKGEKVFLDPFTPVNNTPLANSCSCNVTFEKQPKRKHFLIKSCWHKSFFLQKTISCSKLDCSHKIQSLTTKPFLFFPYHFLFGIRKEKRKKRKKRRKKETKRKEEKEKENKTLPCWPLVENMRPICHNSGYCTSVGHTKRQFQSTALFETG